MSGDVLGVVTAEEGTPGLWWVEARDAAKHRKGRVMAPTTRETQAQTSTVPRRGSPAL